MKKIIIHDFAGHPFAFELSKELSKKYKIYHLFFKNDYGPKAYFGNTVNKNLKILPLGKDIKYSKTNLIKRFFSDLIYGLEVSKNINKINPEIVLSGQCPTFAQQLIVNRCKKDKIKFIVWIQDFYCLAVKLILKKKNIFLSFVIYYIFKFFEKNQINFSSKIITISNKFNKQLKEWGVNNKKISFIANWGNVSQIKFNKKKNFKLTNHIFNKNKFRVIYTGTLAKKHNPNLLISLAESNSNIEFVIFGVGTGFDYIKSLNKIPKNLLLFKLQPFQKLNNILNTADLFIATLNKDANEFSVPSKILNYLCAGRPIILNAPRENLASKIIIQNNCGAIFKDKDIKKITNYINYLKKNKKTYRKISLNCRNFAIKNFDIKKISSKFDKIFQTS